MESEETPGKKTKEEVVSPEEASSPDASSNGSASSESSESSDSGEVGEVTETTEASSSGGDEADVPGTDDGEEREADGVTSTAESDDEDTASQAPTRPLDVAEVLIEVKGLTKHYGDIRAVDAIDLKVHRGDVLAFLGPNGAGKTTAMKMITGFLEPDSGEVEVCGQVMGPHATEVKKRIGYLPENAPAYGEMTVQGFLEFIADAREVSNPAAAIDRVIGMTGLSGVRGQVIETLSKGYKRRVGLAQALIHDPEVLILDEPTDGLDPNQKAMVQELLSSIAVDRCIVVSTHILDEAERICNRALIISNGKIVVDSTPQELMCQAPGHNAVRVTFTDDVHPDGFIGDFSGLDWCEGASILENGEVEIRPRSGKSRLPEIMKLLEDKPVERLRVHEGRLDDLFRELTKGVTT